MPETVTKEEAHRLLVENSWAEESETCGHPGCTEHRAETSRMIHTFMGPFGADWDLADAEREIETATAIGWAQHLLGHDLAIRTAEGKLVYFDVRRPKAVADA